MDFRGFLNDGEVIDFSEYKNKKSIKHPCITVVYPAEYRDIGDALQKELKRKFGTYSPGGGTGENMSDLDIVFKSVKDAKDGIKLVNTFLKSRNVKNFSVSKTPYNCPYLA